MFAANYFGQPYFGQSSARVGVFTVNADPGTYQLTGVQAGVLAARLVDAVPGSYTLTGVAANLVFGAAAGAFSLVADPGTYALTGTATASVVGRMVNADPGSYALTGVATGVLVGRALIAVPGVYTLTGVAAFPIAFRLFSLDPGSYALTGVATGLVKAQALTLTDHPTSTLTLVDATGATLTLVDHIGIGGGGLLTLSGTPTFNADSSVTINAVSDRVEVPATKIDETQCWVAYRIRPSYASTDDPMGGGLAPIFFAWGTSTDRLAGGYSPSVDKWFVQRAATGGAAAEFINEGTAESFAAGDSRTVIFAFESTRIRVSGQGRAFTNSAAAADIPTLAATTFDIASDQNNSRHLAGDILWFACGTGTLTDANAATIHAFGDNGASISAFPAAGLLTAFWNAESAAYELPGGLTLADHTPVSLTLVDH